ncbi:MAG: amino acid-binding protein, partial [Gammaproteobacteria bacterium]|nr:amino acid-binding protein [Gammaproteobacteria bacterium]
MNKWYMLTVVGKDRPGIVAHISGALFEGGCQLGEASMMRLGGNFTIMLMVNFKGTAKALEALLASESQSLALTVHIDVIDAHLHDHRIPDVRISVHGDDA